MGNASSLTCGKIDKPHKPIKKTEIIQTQSKTQSKALPRSFDREANNIVPTDMTYCRGEDGVYSLKRNQKITGFVIRRDDIWLFKVTGQGMDYKYGKGEDETEYLLFNMKPTLMVQNVKGYYMITISENTTNFINTIKVIEGVTDFPQGKTETIGFSLSTLIQTSTLSTIYFNKTLCETMTNDAMHGTNEVYAFKNGQQQYHALKVEINGIEMYAYAMPPITTFNGAYKKKKTSTKTKTQAKHTFIHGKKTYTRVIHLGKRGGKYVMLNGELVPIYKLQTSS